MSAWTDDVDKNLADAYEAIDIIDWSLDAVVMHYKNHTPHPAISHFIAAKQTTGHCYPCDQYVLSLKNAVHLHIRLFFIFQMLRKTTEVILYCGMRVFIVVFLQGNRRSIC